MNDQPIPSATTPELSVTNVQPGNAGRYRVRVVNPTNTVAEARTNVSIPAFLQLSTNGAGGQEIVAREKFAESERDLGLRHNSGGNIPASVARGYTGTQVFSTYGATSEPGEPVHCGVGGGASQWFAYQAEADGA